MLREPTKREPANSRSFNRWDLVKRFLLFGATVGLPVGLYEAALLSSAPRVPGLLEPDISMAIWFLDPPISMAFLAFVGLLLGCCAILLRRPNTQLNAVLTVATLGAAGAWVVSIRLLFPLDGKYLLDAQTLLDARNLVAPLAGFAMVFTFGLLSLRVCWSHAARLFAVETPWPLRAWSRTLLGLTVFLVATLVFFRASRTPAIPAVQAGSPPALRGPNFVFIILDTVNADHLSAYGYFRATTPNMDHLAAKGVLFENAISPSSWTLASDASIFTGLLPHQHGANWYNPRETSTWTLTEVLQSYGYVTAGFNANLHYGQKGWGLKQGFDTYEDESSFLRHGLAATLLGRAFVQPFYEKVHEQDRFDRLDAREVNREVFHWLRNNSDQPYFLFVNYYDAHDPYLAQPPFNRRFQPTETNPDRAVSNYDNCLAFMDDQADKLLKFLANRPEWSNTIVIVISDHGEALGEHGRYGHGWNLYREELHVPLIFFGPGIPPGQRVTHIARTREMFATVLDLALGDKVPLRRYSLRRFWTPGFKPEAFDDTVTSELITDRSQGKEVPTISLMTPEWHYLHNSQGQSALYQWTADPLEKVDLATLPQCQKVKSDLHAHLSDLIRFSERPWFGADYIDALNQPGYSFRRDAILTPDLHGHPPPKIRRVGASQAYFPRRGSPLAVRPKPADEDLLRSLPYH